MRVIDITHTHHVYAYTSVNTAVDYQRNPQKYIRKFQLPKDAFQYIDCNVIVQGRDLYKGHIDFLSFGRLANQSLRKIYRSRTD